MSALRDLRGRFASCSIGNDARPLGKMASRARLGLCVFEIHDRLKEDSSRLGGWRFSRGEGGDYCLMIDVRVLLVQLCRQALSRCLLEALGPGSHTSVDGGLPMDSVRFHKTTVGRRGV